MTKGRFEQGRWIEEQDAAPSVSMDGDVLEDRLVAAKKSFGKGLDDILSIGHELLTTEEGRRHLGRSMDKTCNEVIGTLEETARKASELLNSLLDQKRNG
jgi:hypothetical protein